MVLFALIVAGIWVRVLLFGVPAAFIVVGVASLVRLVRFHRGAAATDGTVCGFDELKDPEGGTLYRSLIRFTAEGRDWQVADILANGWHAHREGQVVRLHYPAGDPAGARVWRPWYLALFVGVIAVGVAVLGLVWTRF